MNANKNRAVAIGAVLVMCLTAFAGMCLSTDDSDAYSTVTIEAGESKWFSLAQLGLSSGDVDDMNNMDSYNYCSMPSVMVPSSANNSGLYGYQIRVSGLDYSGATLTCPDNVRPGTYSLEWGFMDEAGAEEIVITYTNVNVTNNHDGSSSSKPMRGIDWFVSVPQNYGSYTHSLYIESGASVNLRMSGFGYTPTMSATPGSGISVSEDGDHRVTFSGTIGANATLSLTYGAYNWTYNLYVVQTSVSHTIAYSGNGSTGGSTASTVVTDTNNGSTNVTLAASGFSKTGYTFAGWLVNGNVYQPGQSVPVGANGTVTATAQWSQNTLSATANNISGVSGQAYSNQIGASANNGGSLSYAVKSCTGGNATVNSNGLVTYTAPTVSSTSSFTVTVTVTGTFAQGGSLTKDVSFSVTVDPVLSFTNSATSGTLSVKGA
ncbi:MAG: hypothetical protein II855_08305 [Candidatus Methanomethylophilaceae archaeon]|nr:hypothetical protein [Candidatus Methanomethylophilaceae archaeon]